MANDAECWLSAAAYRTVACSTLAPVTEVRFRDLPPRHKRELAALAAAGVVSTALLLVPLIVRTQDDRALPARSLRLQLLSAPALSPAVPAPIAPRPARARGARPLDSNPPLVEARPLSATVVQLTASTNSIPGEMRTTAHRNPLARVLLGDGRHRVRPFPSPADQN